MEFSFLNSLQNCHLGNFENTGISMGNCSRPSPSPTCIRCLLWKHKGPASSEAGPSYCFYLSPAIVELAYTVVVLREILLDVAVSGLSRHLALVLEIVADRTRLADDRIHLRLVHLAARIPLRRAAGIDLRRSQCVIALDQAIDA